MKDDVSGNLTTNDFRDHGSHSGTEYTYDVIGRLLTDDNKHITNIQYNYLNLPEQINFGDTARIVYLYDAAGRKISKKVIHGLNQESVDQTDYINGFVYSNNSLEFINMSDGRLFKKGDGTFRYDYHLKDHLGNVRCTFTDLNDNGHANIIQEDHFYPFGMSIDGLSYRGDLENNFLYQGKERQPEALDTDDDGIPDKRFLWYDFSARYYDPQLGRWHVSDPANQHYSGYLAMASNPINSIDPDGLFADRLSFLGTTLIGMDAYKKSTWNRTHSHFEWRYDGSLAFVRKGDWVFETEYPRC
ncbi:MAG: RHS repeat-associated core domain-containing protein [Bacteroidota bacterium]|nr:RHS repeat-associated core domain-containing protein [Bacteroidota bacterium]